LVNESELCYVEIFIDTLAAGTSLSGVKHPFPDTDDNSGIDDSSSTGSPPDSVTKQLKFHRRDDGDDDDFAPSALRPRLLVS